MSFALTVNGVARVTDENKSLLRYLRDDLHLTSVKDGCSEGACGACTVLLDGKAVRACVYTTQRAAGRSVTTVEGLSDGPKLSPLQQSFIKHGALQCGFCTPGFLMSATALLNENPHPTREEIIDSISGNLCRCTGYKRIVEAIEEIAARGQAADTQE